MASLVSTFDAFSNNMKWALLLMQKALAGLRRIELDGLRWRVFDAKGQVWIYCFMSILILNIVSHVPYISFALVAFQIGRKLGEMCIV